MSTEAQRAPHPPRPATPPPPSTPPRPPHPPADDTHEPDRWRPGTGTGPRGTSGTTPTGGAANGTNGTAPVQPKGRTSGGTGAFDVRRPAASPSADTGGAEGDAGDAPVPALSSPASSPPRPSFPGFGAGGRSGQGGPAGTGAGRGTDGAAPPPPRASARFPDTPPAVGRGTPSPATSPNGPATVPPQPAHGPDRPGRQQRPAAVHTDTLRTDARPKNPPETTTRPGPAPVRASAPAQPTVPPVTRPPVVPSRPAAPPLRAERDGAWVPAPRPGAEESYGSGRATVAHLGPGTPDPAFSWSPPVAPGGASGPGRPVVTFARPEGYDENGRPHPLGRRVRSQAVAAAVCLVLGVGLIGGAAAGSWLAGDSGETEASSGFAVAGSMWHNVPVDELFPPTLQGKGAGPGDADRVWTRIAVAPDSGCEDAFDPLLRKLLAPAGCERLLRATYTDVTQSHVTTVGLLFTQADAVAMASLADRFDKERLDRRTDLMPRPYAAKGTAAAGFGAGQRAAWAISVLTDAPVVVYTVSGWADGRGVDTPLPAEDAMESGATTAPAQAGLGHEARGLADRVERGLRKNIGTTTEQPS
ncbi:hypothetical protein [Streptomyces sp. KMM 9044]|uniref:hypothetical protein n=1 Tax=Streptomyces sp. KMM 9044 TaxID=2744474 RepID=UPI00215088B6|nr:hypothetical protein [Streptomyces sp. KMM 9044]WAX80915.1 hypothetical protein HUV60_027890 [Streptomyces sp. KMM 9044]